ncbi:MAG: hypothetical protein HN348_12065 [Proteobacteria bacterium]|jgi:TldD protein|nr:hypothetical protein [Pseudomonadota bacterium]
MIALTLVGLALAQDPVMDGLKAELDRNMAELALPDADGPYFIAYELHESFDVHVRAMLGGIVADRRDPSRSLGVSVRVGSPEMDNSGFRASFRGTGFDDLHLSDEASPEATRRAAWYQTDECYKGAVEILGRKEAARRNQREVERPANFVLTRGAAVALAPQEPPDKAAADKLATLCRDLSAVFLSHPEVEHSEVHCISTGGRRVTLDSLGTNSQVPIAETDVRIVGMARADDGATMSDHASWVVRTIKDLPPRQEMLDAAEELALRLEDWRQAEAMDERYVGPVLFVDEAAVSLFRELMVPALSGTPPPEREKFSGGATSDGGLLSLKRRILPPGFSVWDDPQLDSALPSSYKYDNEGIEGQKVDLVQDGLLRDMLMSRIPNLDIEVSNGHGRSLMGDPVRGMPSNMVVEAPHKSEKKFLRAAWALAAPYDLDYLLVVRRLADAAVASKGGTKLFSFFDRRESSGLSDPVEVVRLYPDGREEVVRGYRFGHVDRRTLRDIATAGQSETRTFLHSHRGSSWSLTYGLPTTLTAPEVLITELELVPIEEVGDKPPLLESPLAEN